MELKNPLYKNIGVHVITSIFTVEKGVTKVLLVKRINNPFNGYWSLPSGSLYNNELISDFENLKIERNKLKKRYDQMQIEKLKGFQITINLPIFQIEDTLKNT